MYSAYSAGRVFFSFTASACMAKSVDICEFMKGGSSKGGHEARSTLLNSVNDE